MFGARELEQKRARESQIIEEYKSFIAADPTILINIDVPEDEEERERYVQGLSQHIEIIKEAKRSQVLASQISTVPNQQTI